MRGNIAYALHLLGGDARIMATVGANDADRYLERLDSLGLSKANVRVVPTRHRAGHDHDRSGEQSDHRIPPGAMMESHLNRADEVPGVKLGIVAPDGFDGMVQHAEQFAKAGIPFIFDPGQGLPLFDGATLRRIIELATFVAVNDYEGKLVSDKTGWSEKEIASRVQALIVTRGEHGATILHKNGEEQIPVVQAERIVDPTGCGDAFRGGLLYGIENGLDWATTGRLASLMGSIKIAHQGPQTYALTRADVDARFEAAFGYSLK